MKYFNTQKKAFIALMIAIGILVILTIISAEGILNFPLIMIITLPSILGLLIATPFILNKIDK